MDTDKVNWAEIQAAYDKVPYPQASLLSESQFKSALTNRGMSLFPNGLQHLMDSGIIQPLREDPPQFHPFQTWLVSRFLSIFSIGLTPQFNYSGLDLELAYKNMLRQWERLLNPVRGFSKGKDVTEFKRILPLLFLIESYYLPRTRGPRPGVVHFVGHDFDGWIEWCQKQNPETWLKETGLSIDEVKLWHHFILWEAHKLDPAKDWYLLIRSTDYSKRDRLRGPLRLAYDFYDMAEILRLYIEDVSGEKVRKEWNPSGHPDTTWVKQLYGVDEVQFGSRGLLRPLIRAYGLDPGFRVRWLVEGPTEQAFIETYCEALGISLEEHYITFLNFKGETNFQKRLDVINQELELAKSDQCFVTLTMDDTVETRDRIKELQTMNLVSVSYALNNPDFERQNLSLTELVEVVYQWADEWNVSIPITTEQFIEEVKGRLHSSPTMLKGIVNSALSKYSVPFYIDKGEEWGKRLAQYMIGKHEQQSTTGDYAEANLSKIERQILGILRASEPHIDYPLSIEHTNFSAIELT